MKYLLVLGSLLYPDRFYSLEILQQCFIKKGDSLDIYYCTDGWKGCSSAKPISQLRKIINQYDVMLVGFVTKQSRKDISGLVSKFNGKILYLKINTCLEFTQFPVRKSIYYGIPSDLYQKYNHHHMPPKLHRKVQINCPFLGTLKWQKPGMLNREKFVKKYRLNPGQKICLLVPGRWDKLLISMEKLENQEAWRRSVLFLEKLEEILDLFNLNGYQIILKEHNHLYRYLNVLQENKLFNKLSKLIQIDTYDTYEALKYSSRAITLNSLIAYELYLYRLPVLDFGTGCYFFQWGCGKMKDHPTNLKLQKEFSDGEKMIYGRLLKMDEWEHLDHVIPEFLQSHYPIENFPYLENHPIFGQTDLFSPEDFHHVISAFLSDIPAQ